MTTPTPRWLGGSCESDPLGCAEIINGVCPSCGRVFPDVVERLAEAAKAER